MRNLARLIFDADSPLSILFTPFYYLAEMVLFVGISASRVRRKGRDWERAYEAEEVDLSVEASGATRRKGGQRQPQTVEELTVFWGGEQIVRLVGLAITFAAFSRALRRAEVAVDFFAAVLGLEALVRQGVQTRGTRLSEEALGSARNDVSRMGGGDDAVQASKGRDDHDGGAGEDTYSGADLNRALTVDLQRGFARKQGAGRDTIKKFENVQGSDRNDRIKGDGGDNALGGNDGNDRLWGRGGSDRLFGGDGNDRLYGGPGDDFLYGGEGSNSLNGGAGNDELFGGSGRDTLEGGAGDDKLYGGAGGGTLDGGAGGDELYGGEDAETLLGGAGDDTLFAGGGDDVLEGGPGTDVLYGGEGADVFRLDPAPAEGGPDRIIGFDRGEGDRLSLEGDPSDYEAVVAGGATEIRRGGETVAVLDFVEDADALQDALFQ